MTKDEFEFLVYMIHACANKWGKSPTEVYSLLKEKKVLTKYLLPHYDVLYTQGTDFVVADIEEYLENRKDTKV